MCGYPGSGPRLAPSARSVRPASHAAMTYGAVPRVAGAATVAGCDESNAVLDGEARRGSSGEATTTLGSVVSGRQNHARWLVVTALAGAAALASARAVGASVDGISHLSGAAGLGRSWSPSTRAQHASAPSSSSTSSRTSSSRGHSSVAARTRRHYASAAPWRDAPDGASLSTVSVSASDETWSKRFTAANEALGLPSKSFVTDADFDELRAWTFARFEPSWTHAYSTSRPGVGGVDLTYYSVFKAANNNIRHSLGMMTAVEEDSLNGTDASLDASLGRREDSDRRFGECAFTFIRDPLERFISAYAEFEYRATPEMAAATNGACVSAPDWVETAFGDSAKASADGAKPPAAVDDARGAWPPGVGTKSRARLALRLIASLAWVDHAPNDPDHAFDPTQDPLPAKRELNCLVAFHHFFAQSSNFVANAPPSSDDRDARRAYKSQVPLNFVGKVERFEKDWAALGEFCGVTPLSALEYRDLPDGGGHPFTSDSAAQDAMTALLEEDEDAMVAFCLMYLDDYRWGGYELPEACAKSDLVRLLR